MSLSHISNGVRKVLCYIDVQTDAAHYFLFVSISIM